MRIDSSSLTAWLRRSGCLTLLATLPLPLPLPLLAQAQTPDTVVKLVTKPLHAGVATLVREMSFGSLDGPDEYVLGAISEIAVARDGSIYVFDRQVPSLRKYDAAGKFVKLFGRKGQGPGEYLNAGGLVLSRDGRVLLWDTGNWRVNVYAPDGAALPSWSTASGADGSFSFTTGRSLLVDTAGRVYVKRPIYAARGRQSRTVWIRYRVDGTVIDTLEVPQFAYTTPEVRATSASGNSVSTGDVPFSAVPKWAMSPFGSLVTGIPSRYAFEIHPGPGKPVVSVRRDVPPTSVSGQERDSARAAVEQRMRRTDPAWSWNGPDIPKTKPFYAGLSFGEDGRIWVPIVAEVTPAIGGLTMSMGAGMGRTGIAPTPPTNASSISVPRPALFDVYEPDGTYFAQVEVPPRVASVVRRGDYIWGIQFDDDDVEHVVRFRIVFK